MAVRAPHRFPLASLLLLTACVAILMAGTRSALTRSTDTAWVLLCMALGAAFGAVVGAWIGVVGWRGFRQLAFSGFIGALAGGVAGTQLGSPAPFSVALGSSAVLIVLAFLFRPAIDIAPAPPPEMSRLETVSLVETAAASELRGATTEDASPRSP